MTATPSPEPRATSPHTRRDSAFVVLLVLLVWAVLLPESPLLRPMPPRDSGMFLYGGQLLNKGKALYLDFWDHKPPLIFAINALGLRLGGGSMLGVYALEALALAATVIASTRLLKRSFGTGAAVFATAGWAAALTLVINGNQIEEWALPLQFGALLLFMRGEQRTRGGWPLVVAGGMVGLLFFLRPNMIGVGIALGGFLLLRLLFTRNRHDDLLRLIQFCTGGLVVLLITVVLFALSGTLDEMWFAAITYNTLYAANATLARGEALRWGVDLLLPSGLPIIALIGWLAGVGTLIATRRLPPLVAVTLIALPLELIFASLSARRYDHYYVALLPACAILAAYVGSAIITGAGRAGSAWAAALTVSVVLLPAIQVINRTASAFPIPENSAFQRVVTVIQEETEPGDSVLIWGAQPLLNFLADRPEPSRYFFHSPLFMAGYASPEVFETFLSDLRANPPTLIIDTAITDRGFGPLDPERRATWLAEVSGRDPAVTAIPEISVIYDYFATHYERVGAFNFGWEVYRRVE